MTCRIGHTCSGNTLGTRESKLLHPRLTAIVPIHLEYIWDRCLSGSC
uniref:Uncharacterized protein n=1 Tax=Arundo donax TaxID=35708 RepID=A0A0A9CFB6_ARUDO